MTAGKYITIYGPITATQGVNKSNKVKLMKHINMENVSLYVNVGGGE